MDYKYIEQLLERYWDCETNLEEEQILRSFFNQKEIPAELIQYKEFFVYETESKKECLGEDFDKRIMKLVEVPKRVSINRITWKQRLAPLFKAAAVVAVIITIGNAMRGALTDNQINSSAGKTEIGSTYVKADNVEKMFNVEENAKAETTIDSILTYPTKDAEAANKIKEENFSN